jgi:hypothetical protein
MSKDDIQENAQQPVTIREITNDFDPVTGTGSISGVVSGGGTWPVKTEKGVCVSASSANFVLAAISKLKSLGYVYDESKTCKEGEQWIAPQPAQQQVPVALQHDVTSARQMLEDRWDAEGHCRSCGWHAALYEHDVTDSDIAEALASFGGILQLGCRSKDADDNDLHRGVRVNLRD